MKRCMTLLLILVLALGLGMNALADVIFEPEDAFLQKHIDECSYENRVYVVTVDGEAADIFEDPKGKPIARLPAGVEYLISWIWPEDGGWGLLDFKNWKGEIRSGWIRLRDLTVKYDSMSFAQEHASEFLYPEEPVHFEPEDCSLARFWPYPGADAPTGFAESPTELQFNTLYEDPEGRRWGFVSYYYGHRNFWVCLTEPEAEAFPAPGVTPTPRPAPTPRPTAMPPLTDPDRGGDFPWLPAGLAGGAVVIAGVLLAVFRKKK